MGKLLDNLRNLEVALHQYEVRINIGKLTELLHPNFIEIGYSGRTYNFKSILNNMLSEQPSSFKVWSQDYEYNEYASNVVQVIYRSAKLSHNGALTNHAKRSSI